MSIAKKRKRLDVRKIKESKEFKKRLKRKKTLLKRGIIPWDCLSPTEKFYLAMRPS